MTWRKTSWQWQLVLIMMLVSGLALLSFIGVLWQIVRVTTYKKIDAELIAFSLKQGPGFIVSLNMEENRNPRPREESTGDTVRTNTMAFYNSRTGFNHMGTDWPEDLDVVEIGKSIQDLYDEQGKMMPPESRLLDLQRRSPEELRQQADGRLGRLPRQQLPSLNRSVFTTIKVEGQPYRVMGYSDGVGVFMAAHDMDREQHDMYDLRQAIVLALPGAILIIGLIAWYLAAKAIGPVRRLTDSSSHITAEALDKRLTQENEPPEFAELIQVYNEMLDRLENSFKQARRFSADAAHELNTPLTILRGHLDLMLQSAEENTDAQQQLALVFEEVRGLQEVIRKLLVLSQADSGLLPIEPKELDFSLLISEIIEDAELMAPEIKFERDIEDSIEVKGDRDLLRQCVFNMVTNAIKYNRENGFIRLSLRKSRFNVDLDITNTGKCIPENMAPKVFDRFVRADPSRDSKVNGRGLGLSLAREFAKAHHGTLELLHNEDDQITFRLELPV
jgi:two-component system heavy metal sensor histidine kinase CusS